MMIIYYFFGVYVVNSVFQLCLIDTIYDFTGLVILYYIIKIPFAEAQRLEMIRYLRSIMCPDGGWGM